MLFLSLIIYSSKLNHLSPNTLKFTWWYIFFRLSNTQKPNNEQNNHWPCIYTIFHFTLTLAPLSLSLSLSLSPTKSPLLFEHRVWLIVIIFAFFNCLSHSRDAAISPICAEAIKAFNSNWGRCVAEFHPDTSSAFPGRRRGGCLR